LHRKYHIGVKWQIAQALGGVRLLVKSEDIEKAKCILNTDDSSLLENVKFPPIEKEDICHKCGSENLEYINLRRYSGALMMLTGLPIIFWGTYSKCKECGYKNRN
jgi:hypothetical protein